MSKKKIKYETDTPVQGKYREHALSALEKFHKFHEENRKQMSEEERTIDDREFNYYFSEGTVVELDERMLPSDDGPLSFTPNIRQHIGKKGVVKKYYSDMHAFGRGDSYSMDVEFGGELVKGLWAPYLIKPKQR